METKLINIVDSSSESLEINQTSIDRREFFKLKFMLMFYMFFSDFFGNNLLEVKNKQKLDYSLLNKLLKLDFSEEVKKEIMLRVALQKKYAYDANGYLQPLDRFLKETICYIIYKNNFHDFLLLSSLKDKQIDYMYMFNHAIKRGAVQQLKYMQKKLISTDNIMLKEALIYAFKSKSKDTVLHFLEQKICLDNHAKNSILKIFKNNEYDNFKKELIDTKGIKLLPSKSQSKNIRDRQLFRKIATDIYYDDEFFILNQHTIVNNALVDLYKQNIIDDFSINIKNEEINVFVYQSSGVYTINFIYLLDKAMGINGMHTIDIKSKEIVNKIMFSIQRNYSYQFMVPINDFSIKIDVL